MKQAAYRDQDYAFGQRMLNLRSAIGMTQGGLAERIGVSRRSVAEWEAGGKYPKAKHLQTLIALGIEHHAFPAGREASDIRELWKASHQKVLLDEAWLARLIGKEADAPGQSANDANGRRVDWGDALAVANFYGRDWEMRLLTEWVIDQHCRVITVLGMGGIGKSSLTVSLMRQIGDQFDAVIWRSLRDAPSSEALLNDLLQGIDPSTAGTTDNPEQRLSLLLDQLRQRRVLLVLDNLEALLEPGESVGQMRPGYDSYAQLLLRIAETEHQSCLILTSREKPDELVPLEGNQSPVRTLRLTRLDNESCKQLLIDRAVTGTDDELAQLIDGYNGNPLALKIVTQTIVDLFDGEVALFLEQGEVVFGGVRALLAQQFGRLSALERTVMLWLAILREPTPLEDLLAVLVTPVTRARLIEVVSALHRRSLVERGQTRGTFTLQSVVLEFLTAQLIEDISDEIVQGRLVHLVEHGLELARAGTFVRETQQRLILTPILDHLRGMYSQSPDIDAALLNLLDGLRRLPEAEQGYARDTAHGFAPANLIALLKRLNGHLHGLDLSRLVLRESHLQDVEMWGSSLTGATFRDSTFTETFDGIVSLSVGGVGEYWAATTTNNEIRLWRSEGRIQHRAWGVNIQRLWVTSFSPDEKLMALGGVDGSIEVWDVADGTLIWAAADGVSDVIRLAFSPDGTMLAATHEDGKVHLWNTLNGSVMDVLPQKVLSPGLAWSPDSAALVVGSVDGSITLWSIQADSEPLLHFAAHEQPITGMAFSPDGTRFVSAGWDGLVKIWNTADGSLEETLTGHRGRVFRVTWSPDGQVIASGGDDKIIRLWDVTNRRYRAALHGHKYVIRDLAFTGDSRTLISGGPNGGIGVWDVVRCTCNRMIQGYVLSIREIAWSPDSTQIAAASDDAALALFDLSGKTPPQVLYGHHGIISEIVWNPTDNVIASSEMDSTIRLWDSITGRPLEGLSYPGAGVFNGMAWNPDGLHLSAGTALQGIQLYDMETRTHHRFGDDCPDGIGHVVFSPDGKRLVGTTGDGVIYVWDGVSGVLLHRLSDYQGFIPDIAWSADSTRLALCYGGGKDNGVFIWDMIDGKLLHRINDPADQPESVEWGENDAFLITGSGDGVVRWYDLQSDAIVRERKPHRGVIRGMRISPDRRLLVTCGTDGAVIIYDLHTGNVLKTLRRDRPYERMDITGVRGLNDAQKSTLRALGAVES